ncbi:MAG: NADH:ubiquinone reductase (Na(+)-transporting) subunit A [Marinilabiliales bacterium]|nr:MAG: NADH:ubiquinone reductase (Na(+)-transporting) subunit A [Marinilabiliales bacterium]
MSRSIKLKKGLDIQLLGEAEKVIAPLETLQYALKPTDFPGIFPKLLVKAGDTVKAGTPVFYDKYREEIKVCSPVSGTVTDIVRGEKRALLEIRIEADKDQEYLDFGKADPSALSGDEIKEKLLTSGLWPSLIQRPYAVVADYDKKPKTIIVSGFNTAPLAPDMDMLVHGHGPEFQTGLDALAKMTDGVVHLNLKKDAPVSKVFEKSKNVQINYFDGPHPAGNPGIQLHHLDPLNKGQVAWYLSPCAVMRIGRLFLTGKYDDSRLVALTGSEVKRPGYYRLTGGAQLKEMFSNNLSDAKNRIISGDVLTGTKIPEDGYLGFYDNQVTVIPEGDHSEFLGWIMPGFKKYSTSRAFFSWLTPQKKYRLDTNLHGGVRSFVVTGEMEKFFPMDILPMYLIKAILVKDIDQMENLGIYEVGPEDFALAEFANTSKENLQKIVREGLEYLRKEMN